MKKKCEYGDFQTPYSLAVRALKTLPGIEEPQFVLEPTCGKGAFLKAAYKLWGDTPKYFGLDLNQEYVSEAKASLSKCQRLQIEHDDFFKYQWPNLLKGVDTPVLLIGNPPWVTNSDLGYVKSSNLPTKSNFLKYKGFEALTGKSNFDISEWMLIQYAEWLKEKKATVAVLCKTYVARKVLTYVWSKNYSVSQAKLYGIDALEHFNASVDASFFVMQFNAGPISYECEFYDSLDEREPSKKLGFYKGKIYSDIEKYQKLEFLSGKDPMYVWRSGVKHDCSKVFELTKQGKGYYKNGYNEDVFIEEELVFPLYKSSDVGNGELRDKNRYILVTQKKVSEPTDWIEDALPLTWEYLTRHSAQLDKRGSSIYKNKPRFSLFGIGEYTFSPWKVAISGMYKGLNFKKVGPKEGKPSLFDDTVNFVSCSSEDEASFVLSLLKSPEVTDFLESQVFWEDKRPITIELLKKLSIQELSKSLNVEHLYNDIAEVNVGCSYPQR